MMDELQTVKLRTKKLIYVLIGFLTFLMATLIVSVPNLESSLVRWGLFISFGGISLVLFLSILTGQPRLKLTSKSLESQMFFLTRKVHWVDIAELKEYVWHEDRVLGLNYVQGRALKSSPFNQNLTGFEDSFLNSSNLKFDEFRDLIFSYWEHAKQAQALELSRQAKNPRLKTD